VREERSVYRTQAASSPESKLTTTGAITSIISLLVEAGTQLSLVGNQCTWGSTTQYQDRELMYLRVKVSLALDVMSLEEQGIILISGFSNFCPYLKNG